MDDLRAVPPSLTGLTTYLLSRTGKIARGRLAGRLAERGLRLWHHAVLAALADFGPHVQRDLAARLAIDPSDMAKIVDELAGAGNVERARDTADRRRITVTLTDAGRTLLAELEAEAVGVQDEVLAPLTENEREQLDVLLRKVFQGLVTE
ncbi:MarR family winged helix-turn-helix transcriptional regulator [Catenulispora rubra]|uniref:MarR family winged helix-turn-helix transcriptional regulator n=1 Tax=Catenulispora rubra TaxID=280293 RepID=UPI0018925F61|nr:MarR family winged helix-turn-helix transcriptional regulator [Catenulispora rubra]